jgi:hypothetical protein
MDRNFITAIPYIQATILSIYAILSGGIKAEMI